MIVTCKKPCGVAGRLPKWPRILLGLGFFSLGCTSIPSGTGTTGNGGDGAGNDNMADSVGSIDNVSSTVTLSGSREFDVIYSIPVAVSLVEAIYVQVADAIPGSAEVGERVVFGQALAGGDSQAVLFDTTLLDPGLYRVGISYVDAFGLSVIFFSDGVVDVQGQPDPVFFEPATSITGEPGIALLVSFDCRDPEDVNVRWRLFYADKTDIEAWAANPASISNPSELGTQLATGFDNTGIFTWSTAGLQPGEYGLGVSATDSGSSIDNTDDNLIITGFTTEDGQLVIVTLVEPEPLPMPPTLIVTAPSTDISVFPGTDVNIAWDVTFFEGPFELITVLRDLDGDFDTTDDQVTLLNNDSSGLSSLTIDTTDLDGLEFQIAVIANDGQNDEVVKSAPGIVTVDGTVIFSVDSPSNDRTVPPGLSVTVEWDTNVPPTLATFDVIVQADPTGDGTELGDPVFLAIDTTSKSVVFDTTGLSGLFVFTVTMTVSSLDAGENVFVESPPGNVRVSTAPRVIWLGDLELTDTEGAIFQGVNFEDNAGSAFTTVNDMDGDGNDDFIIVARYGKPFLDNSSGGIGHGEAYLIYGSVDRLSGELNLNSVGTSLLRGVTFTGIRTPQGIDDTDGLSDVSRIPDQDGDGRDEIVFGFPNVDSRGHNVDNRQDGVQPEDFLSTLERHDQFLRGGLVIVSSKNSILQTPTFGTPVINLDMVGQDFDITCVQREPDVTEDEFFVEVLSLEEENGTFFCEGSCVEPQSDDTPDANDIINYGFHRALADDYFTSMVFGGDVCAAPYFLNTCFPLYVFCSPGGQCTPISPGLHWFPLDGLATGFNPTGFPNQYSGFYPYQWDIDPDNEDDFVLNLPLEPFGARITGVGVGDGFGTSITLSNATGAGAGDMIVSAPNRTAIGILRQTQDLQLQGPEDGIGYVQGGEVDGLEDGGGNWTSHSSSGVAYLFQVRNLWETGSFGDIPPKPHQYIVGEASHSCLGPAGMPPLIANVDATRIAGNTGQKIRNIVGINDFNADGLNDFAVGAPGELGGTLHIVYRRQPGSTGLEGDVVLSKLELDPSDPERLQGSFITGNRGDVNGEGFGASMIAGFDFDGDGLQDLVVSTPNDSLGTGAVDIIFTSPGLITPQGGTSIEDLRNDRRSVRITGLEGGDLFGFNLANAGDVDGDGLDDLLIAAPGASPKHDPNPNDSVDELSAPGLDVNGDGVADFTLDDAGLVYLILGSNVLGDDSFYDQDRFPDGIINISALGTSDLRGAIIVGKAAGDRLGGGDAGSLVEGGITDKAGRGRSFGLKAAGDVDGDGKADILMGSVLADFVDPVTGAEKKNTGEAYLLYGFEP